MFHVTLRGKADVGGKGGNYPSCPNLSQLQAMNKLSICVNFFIDVLQVIFCNTADYIDRTTDKFVPFSELNSLEFQRKIPCIHQSFLSTYTRCLYMHILDASIVEFDYRHFSMTT